MSVDKLLLVDLFHNYCDTAGNHVLAGDTLVITVDELIAIVKDYIEEKEQRK